MPQIGGLRIIEVNLDYNFVYTYLHPFDPDSSKKCPFALAGNHR
jgi:hypothetical protein